ncbi:hypothetical protein NQ317_015349 [Molorchus minor]|uniref:Uncharacterized protein n=1 Tax=Molorchus minor TaxID=1323400 RepID=A0ABQ9ISD8_9CUCU|nr:hypothetical protein NQ317_015349 [Molorchus minor]
MSLFGTFFSMLAVLANSKLRIAYVINIPISYTYVYFYSIFQEEGIYKRYIRGYSFFLKERRNNAHHWDICRPVGIADGAAYIPKGVHCSSFFQEEGIYKPQHRSQTIKPHSKHLK